jgi:hypothetical protein
MADFVRAILPCTEKSYYICATSLVGYNDKNICIAYGYKLLVG